MTEREIDLESLARAVIGKALEDYRRYGDKKNDAERFLFPRTETEMELLRAWVFMAGYDDKILIDRGKKKG